MDLGAVSSGHSLACCYTYTRHRALLHVTMPSPESNRAGARKSGGVGGRRSVQLSTGQLEARWWCFCSFFALYVLRRVQSRNLVESYLLPSPPPPSSHPLCPPAGILDMNSLVMKLHYPFPDPTRS